MGSSLFRLCRRYANLFVLKCNRIQVFLDYSGRVDQDGQTWTDENVRNLSERQAGESPSRFGRVGRGSGRGGPGGAVFAVNCMSVKQNR